MFVVPRTQIQPLNSSGTQSRTTRIAAKQSQRGGSAATAIFQQASVTHATRGEDTSTARPSSQNTATAVTPAANNLSVPAVTTGNLEASGTGMQKLLDTMKSLGMSTSGLNINYSEEFVGYPGGGYTNKQINVTANGKTEHFSADLTDRNPAVTAYEMQKYFGVAGNPTASAGTTRQG